MRLLFFIGMCSLLLAACGNYEGLKNVKSNNHEEMAEQLKTVSVVNEKNLEIRQKIVESALKDTMFGDLIHVEGLNSQEPYSLEIEYKGKENLSEKMTIKCIQLTVRDAVYAIKELGLNIDHISVNIKYPFVDKYGNTTNGYVIKSKYTADTVKRLNEDSKNFKVKNLPIVADEWWIHPSFKE